MSGDRKRTVKLFCPSLSKEVPFVAWDEQRLDLGSIARTFGLDPETLKLNGHFIARGIDHIASSVTWKSLLSFFSSRGFSTGVSDTDALIVDGKLSKVGTKRAHDQTDAENQSCHTIEHQSSSTSTRPQLFKKKKEKENSSECIKSKINMCDGLGLKRKQRLEDIFFPLKKIRTTGTNSGSQAGGNGLSGTIQTAPFRCRFTNDNLKRMREEETAISTPCKKTG